MDHTEETVEGFVVRCYSDDLDRKNYSGIICDVCDSVEDVADAIVEHLEERVEDDTSCEPLSPKIWQHVRRMIVEDATPPDWEFEPYRIMELSNTNVPVSVKVNQVRLSRRLVDRIRSGKS